MIPSTDQLLTGYPFVARRHGRVARADRAAVEAARDHAERLAAGRVADRGRF